MAVPYKQNDTLLQYLQHYKAQTLQCSVKFQTSHSILHRLLQLGRQTQHFFLRHQDELWQNYLKSATSVHQLALVLTLRRLMSYTYMQHPFLMFLDHTQRRSTVGRTPLDE